MSSEATISDRLLKKSEVAEILSTSLRTVERLVSSGKLKPRKIRGCVRFLLSDVLAMMGGVQG